MYLNTSYQIFYNTVISPKGIGTYYFKSHIIKCLKLHLFKLITN